MPDSSTASTSLKNGGRRGTKKWYVAPQTVNNKRTGKDTWKGTLRSGLTENYGYTFARCYASQQAMVSEERRINRFLFFDSGIWCGNIKSSKNKTTSCHHWMGVVSPNIWTEHVPDQYCHTEVFKNQDLFCFIVRWNSESDTVTNNCTIVFFLSVLLFLSFLDPLATSCL